MSYRVRVGNLLDSDPRQLASGGDRMARNDVLIIGAGPSGLFAAAELARHGVDVRLIEQEVRCGTARRAPRRSSRAPSRSWIPSACCRRSSRLPSTSAALDRHLSSYLTPDPTVGPVKEAKGDVVDNGA